MNLISLWKLASFFKNMALVRKENLKKSHRPTKRNAKQENVTKQISFIWA